MFNRNDFKKVFEGSGLTKSELAGLYGVSRQTVYDWCKGDGTPTQRTLVAREQLYTKGLLAALNRGVLPIANVKDPKIRKERILAMAQALHALAKPK